MLKFKIFQSIGIDKIFMFNMANYLVMKSEIFVLK